MVTLPSAQGRSLPSELHQARDIAECFGSDAERYERTRPAYPQAMVEAIIAASPGNRVLDVGIGTGISARPFHQRGCRMLGVEPDERMAQLARRSGFDVDVAAFELWDPTDRIFDLVIAGQSWHWVDPVVGAAKAAEVLIPDGRIALFWNAMVYPPHLARGFAAVYRQVLPHFPFFQNGTPSGAASYAPLTEKAASGIRETRRYSEPELWKFEWSSPYTVAQWLDTVPTFGGHNQIPPDKLAELLDGLRAVIEAAGGSFTMGYDALVTTATRTDIH